MQINSILYHSTQKLIKNVFLLNFAHELLMIFQIHISSFFSLHTDIVQSIKLLIVKLKPNKLIIDYIYRNYGVSFRYVFRIFSKSTVYKMATKSGMTTTVKVVQA